MIIDSGDPQKAKEKMVESMNHTLKGSLKLVKALEKWDVDNRLDPLEVMIALSTYVEYKKMNFVRGIAESEAQFDRMPQFERDLIQNVLDDIVKKEFGPDAIGKRAKSDPKEIRRSIDNMVTTGTRLLLKMFDNNVVREKIERLLKRYS